MKKKNKLSLLQVSSFVTTINEEKEQTVQGGKPTKLTVVTFGLWSYCCNTFTES